jgi:hypothetical protein
MRRTLLILCLATGLVGVVIAAIMVMRCGGDGFSLVAMTAIAASPFTLVLLIGPSIRTRGGMSLFLAATLIAASVCFSIWFEGIVVNPSGMMGLLLWQLPAVLSPGLLLFAWFIRRYEKASANQSVETNRCPALRFRSTQII